MPKRIKISLISLIAVFCVVSVYHISFGSFEDLPAWLQPAVDAIIDTDQNPTAAQYKDGTVILVKPVATGVGPGRYEAGDIVEIRDGQELYEKFGDRPFLGAKERTRLLPLYYPGKLSKEMRLELVEHLSGPEEVMETDEGEQIVDGPITKRRQYGIDYTEFLSWFESYKVRSHKRLRKLPEVDIESLAKKSDSQLSVVDVPKSLALAESLRHGAMGLVHKVAPPVFAQSESVSVVDPDNAAGTDYVSIPAWESAEQADLTSTNEIAVASCRNSNGSAHDTSSIVVTGWTTDATRYIKITVQEQYRHKGAWSDVKFRIYHNNWASGIHLEEGNVRIEYIQFEFDDEDSSDPIATLREASATYYITNSIFKRTSATTVAGGGLEIPHDVTAYLWNNIIYGANGKLNTGIDSGWNSGTEVYAYNNTIYGASTCFVRNGGSATFYAKNNIAQNCTDGFYGTYTNSDYNVSNLASDAPSSSYRSGLSTFVLFASETNEDFHLAPAASTTIDVGTDLSATTTIDIDGGTRSGSWDIGADEYGVADGMTHIYRSIGPGNTAILDDDSGGNTLTISGETATFSLDIPDNVGVGDAIVYDTDADNDLDSVDGIVFIHGRASSTEYTVKDWTGYTTATTTSSNDTWAIYRAYTSLETAESGTKNSSIPVAFTGGNRDLVDYAEVWHLAFYVDAEDSSYTSIDGWTTNPNSYLRVYAPTSTTEVGTSQRHNGAWDPTAARMVFGDVWTAFSIQDDYIRIDGLQIKVTSNTRDTDGIDVNNTVDSSDIRITNNIIYDDGTNTNYDAVGLYAHDADSRITWANNVIDDFGGYCFRNIGATVFAYNNTAVNCDIGFVSSSGTFTAKNNIASTTSDGFAGSAGFTNSDYNVSNFASDAPSASYRSNLSTYVGFVDPVNRDWHLSPNASTTIDAGTDLSGDSVLSFNTDIDGGSRSGSWDLGADESGSAGRIRDIYRSVGPGEIWALETGSGNNLNISGELATFASDLGDNIGVGDAIQYDSNNDSSIDAIAFIHGRTDAKTFTVRSADGGTASSTQAADADWSIFRSYTSLSDAESGTVNTGLDGAVSGFDGWSTGRDIVDYGEYWNIAAYASSTQADTSSVTIDGWTTNPNSFIRIYTPTSTAEVGTSQRHNGKWTEDGYRIMPTGEEEAITIRDPYVIIDGLLAQSTTLDDNYRSGIRIYDSATEIRVRNNIIREGNFGSGDRTGIDLGASGIHPVYISNNIIYGFVNCGGDGGSIGIEIGADNGETPSYVFNNTIYDTCSGINTSYGQTKAVNNLVASSTTAFDGTYYDYSDYNATDNNETTSGELNTNGAGNDRVLQSFSFVSLESGDEDFRLTYGDTGAVDYGTNLSSDTDLAFSIDIQGESRPYSSNWDIGADEYTAASIVETGTASTYDANTTINFTHGLTINEDDVIVAVLHNNASLPVMSDNNGSYAFTEEFAETNGSESSYYAIYYRVAGASEPTSYSWTVDNTNGTSVILRVFDGVDTADVWDVAPSASTRSYSAAGTTATAPSMTTTADDAMGIFIALSDSTYTWSNPTNNYTAEIEESSRSLATYIRNWPTAGSTGSASADLSSSNDWLAQQFTLNPAPPNNAPTISSASDTPDPTIEGDTITFSIDWSDADSGENVRGFICSSNSFTTSTPVCADTTYASSTSFATTDPVVMTYTASSTDIGTNTYYAYVCDDSSQATACSDPTSGTFTVTGILEASAIDTDTTTSGSYELMDSMTLTPGAGDYLAVFSTSVEQDGTGGSATIYSSIFVDGVQQTHTEREMYYESSLDQLPYPMATHAHVSVGAGEAVEVHWYVTNGTATAHNRTLTMYPVDPDYVSQATATGDDTTSSLTDTQLDSMTLTPGAGDYLAVFSTSGDGPTNSELYYSFYVGGSQVAHTQRSTRQESSIAPAELVTFIAAKVSPDDDEAVEVKWSEPTGTGTITSHERTLTLYRTHRGSISQASATGDDVSSATSDTLLGSMTLTPGAGSYLALFSTSLYVPTFGTSFEPYLSFYVDGVQEAQTLRIPGWDESVDSSDMAAMTTGKVSPGAAEDVEVYWSGSTSQSRTSHERTMVLLEYTGDNVAPSISGVTDSPDPVNRGSSVSFAVDWSDPEGDWIKVKICKTDSLTNQNCDGGFYASSSVFTPDDPTYLTYYTQDSDGTSISWYAFACDEFGACSGSTSGSTSLNLPPSATGGGIKLRSGTIKINFNDLSPFLFVSLLAPVGLRKRKKL